MEHAILLGATVISLGLMLGGAAAGSAIGDGLITSKYLEGITRQPELRGMLIGQMFFGVAIIEAVPFIVIGIAFWWLFASPFTSQLTKLIG